MHVPSQQAHIPYRSFLMSAVEVGAGAGVGVELSVSHVRVHPDEDQLRIHMEDAEPDTDADATNASEVRLTSTSAGRHPKLEGLLAQLDGYVISADVISRASEAAQSHYESHNAHLDGLRDVVALMDHTASSDAQEAESTSQTRQAKAIARLLSAALKVTILMIVLKVFSAAWSGSIAVVASAVDSVLDLVSQGGLVLTERFMRRKDTVKYPIGKSRLESLAVMTFGCIMAMAAVILLQQSAMVLQSGVDDPPTINFDIVAIIIMVFTIVVQIGVYAWCRRILATTDSHTPNVGSVDALAQDQMNDIMVNALSTTAAAVATADQSMWYLDPIIGVVVALYMLIRWSLAVREQFVSLMGKSADQDFLNRLTYLATIHDDRILKVDTVVAYQLGTKYHCEVHIVLPADMTLRTAHDIGESLEKNIEKLPEIELAWVHLDFEWQHQAEHRRCHL